MFRTENVEVYLARMTHRVGKDKQRNKKTIVDLAFEMRPITIALATELGIRRHLFLNEEQVVQDYHSVAFDARKLCPKLQAIGFREAPDMPRHTLVIDRAKVSGIAASKGEKSPAWSLTFKASFDHPGPGELAFLNNNLAERVFLTFTDADPSLQFEDTPEPAPKPEKVKKGPADVPLPLGVTAVDPAASRQRERKARAAEEKARAVRERVEKRAGQIKHARPRLAKKR